MCDYVDKHCQNNRKYRRYESREEKYYSKKHEKLKEDEEYRIYHDCTYLQLAISKKDEEYDRLEKDYASKDHCETYEFSDYEFESRYRFGKYQINGFSLDFFEEKLASDEYY